MPSGKWVGQRDRESGCHRDSITRSLLLVNPVGQAGAKHGNRGEKETPCLRLATYRFPPSAAGAKKTPQRGATLIGRGWNRMRAPVEKQPTVNPELRDFRSGSGRVLRIGGAGRRRRSDWET